VLVAEVVHARSESHDLLYHFDAVGRLGEAQALDRDCPAADRAKLLDPCRFISPGPLWWVFDWNTAETQYRDCLHKPARPPEDGRGKGRVLLIDEIDKADADLPNGLLETLGNGAFPVPYLQQRVGLSAEARATPPLVIITTNEERELPPAFVRRCLVLRMTLPDGPLLKRRAAEQPDIACPDEVMDRVLEQLLKDREAAAVEGTTPPGQAEFFDILRALTHMTEQQSGKRRTQEQLRLFGLVQGFFLKKGAGTG
jgi:MoxR-like ATPase